MEMHTISTVTMHDKVYIIWQIPNHQVTGYEIYRNDVLIASSVDNNEKIFVSPTLFDNDHHTNLFRKDSANKLMYVDEDVQRYQCYSYKVVAKIVKPDRVINMESNTAYIQVQ